MTSGGFTYGIYPEIEDLFQQQVRETDRRKREALLHEVQKIAYDLAMFAPIWEFAQLHGVGPLVRSLSSGSSSSIPSPRRKGSPAQEVSPPRVNGSLASGSEEQLYLADNLMCRGLR